MEVCRVGSGIKNKLFFSCLFLLACAHLLHSQVDTMRTASCQRFVIAANVVATARGDMPIVEAVFEVSRPQEKIHRLQTHSVMIAPSDENGFPTGGDIVCAVNPEHGD